MADYGLTHETIGREIIRRDFADLIRRVRRNPNTSLDSKETLDPEQITFLIARPKQKDSDKAPKWLRFLRSLFSGLYTVDNMDFVLRDAYMSGYSVKAFDIDRLLRYSMFTEEGLTIHERGLSALVRFISVRAELFQVIYFHRIVRTIDLELEELFLESKQHLFPGNPLEHLEEYRQLTEWSLLMQVSQWSKSDDVKLRELGGRWQEFLARRLRWKMAYEHPIFFDPGESEQSSVFSNKKSFEAAVRDALPKELKKLPLRFDTPRHVYRPGAHTPTVGQNYLYDPATGQIRRLEERELFRRIAISSRICRIYALDNTHNTELAAAMKQLTGAGGTDDTTNM